MPNLEAVYPVWVEMRTSSLARVAQVPELVDVEPVEAIGGNPQNDPGDDQVGELVILVEQQLTWR